MSTNDRGSRNEDEEPTPLVLHVEFAPGRELRGSIGRRGEPDSVPFRGWIDFMAAVSVLRDGDAASDTSTSGPSPTPARGS